MKNLSKKLRGYCNTRIYLLITIMPGIASCISEPEVRFVEQASVSNQDTIFQAEGKKQYKPYTNHNSVIIISGYREGEYWVSRRGPNGKILWDSLSLNVQADSLR